MIVFYNTKNKRWISGFDPVSNQVKYYDGKYLDHVRTFNDISEEVIKVSWNLPDFVIPVKVPISKLRECMEEQYGKADNK